MKLKNNEKGFGVIEILLVVVVVCALGIVGWYAWSRNRAELSAPSSSHPSIEQESQVASEETTVPSEPAPSPTTNWKPYSDDTYEFLYPPTWKVEPGSPNLEEHYGGDLVHIESPSPSVSIEIGPASFTYGFDNGSTHRDGETLSFEINGRKYSGTEDIYAYKSSRDKTRVFVDVDVPIKDQKFNVLFGTGYPVNEDATASYDNYKKYRDTIVEILNTLKISN